LTYENEEWFPCRRILRRSPPCQRRCQPLASFDGGGLQGLRFPHMADGILQGHTALRDPLAQTFDVRYCRSCRLPPFGRHDKFPYAGCLVSPLSSTPICQSFQIPPSKPKASISNGSPGAEAVLWRGLSGTGTVKRRVSPEGKLRITEKGARAGGGE